MIDTERHKLIPQIIINYHRHNATGLQPLMMMLWAWAGVPLGVYNIIEEFNIALRIQPQILTCLSLITWIQCFYYENVSIKRQLKERLPILFVQKWSVTRSLAVVCPIATVMAGIQASLIVGLRIAKSRHILWPMTLMAVLSATLLAAGVLRHYWDIWIHRTVRGISFIFVAIDAGGDLFSLLSIFFQPTLDIKGIIIYATELTLWLGVFACGGYFNLLPYVKKTLQTHGCYVEPQGWRDHTNSTARARTCIQDVTMNDIPSSTSVFRTPSSDIVVARNRVNATRRDSSADTLD
jgi:hypothetical protein